MTIFSTASIGRSQEESLCTDTRQERADFKTGVVEESSSLAQNVGDHIGVVCRRQTRSARWP